MALATALLTVSCASLTTPLLEHGSDAFRVPPKVVLLDSRRYLEYQLDPKPRNSAPGIKVETVGDEVHCYVHLFISSHSDTPRRIRIPSEGRVFWLNPDGSRMKLEAEQSVRGYRR